MNPTTNMNAAPAVNTADSLNEFLAFVRNREGLKAQLKERLALIDRERDDILKAIQLLDGGGQLLGESNGHDKPRQKGGRKANSGKPPRKGLSQDVLDIARQAGKPITIGEIIEGLLKTDKYAADRQDGGALLSSSVASLMRQFFDRELVAKEENSHGRFAYLVL